MQIERSTIVLSDPCCKGLVPEPFYLTRRYALLLCFLERKKNHILLYTLQAMARNAYARSLGVPVWVRRGTVLQFKTKETCGLRPLVMLARPVQGDGLTPAPKIVLLIKRKFGQFFEKLF